MEKFLSSSVCSRRSSRPHLALPINREMAVSWLLHGVNAVLLPVLLVMVILRETPAFWTNAGGYPIWMRDCVQIVFWPLLGVELVCLLMWSLAIVVQCEVDGRRHWLMKSFAAFGWLFATVIIVIAFWNNFENLLSGQDLHHHASE